LKQFGVQKIKMEEIILKDYTEEGREIKATPDGIEISGWPSTDPDSTVSISWAIFDEVRRKVSTK
jgi:hypothetical protein